MKVPCGGYKGSLCGRFQETQGMVEMLQAEYDGEEVHFTQVRPMGEGATGGKKEEIKSNKKTNNAVKM